MNAKSLGIMISLLGLMAVSAQAGTWTCNASSSRGNTYSWASPDRYDAEANANRTCDFYETPYGATCYQATCAYEDDYPSYPTSWTCYSSSSRGNTYSWASPDRNDAEYNVDRTCNYYEAPYGGSCGTPACYSN